MSDTLDELLRAALKAEQKPARELDCRILGTWVKEVKEKKGMKKNNRRTKIAAAAVTACLLSVGGLSVYAAYRYLTPAQVAEEIYADSALAEAFEDENAVEVNLTQQSNGYDVTLLGLTSGEQLSLCLSADNAAQINEKRTYAVLAVAHSDRTPMEDESVCVSPLINGVDWVLANNSTMNVSAGGFVEDGVLYWLVECDDLEIFADRGVQLGVVDAFGSEGSAFEMDEDTGAYRRVEGYAGTNALFELPLDASKADAAAAEAYLDGLKERAGQSGDDAVSVSRGSEDLDAFYAALADTAEDDAAFLEEYATLLDTQTLTVDADGNISYSNADDGSAGGSYNVSDWQIGEKMILSIGDSGSLDSVCMNVFTLNADGTVTYERYAPLAD